MKNPIYSGKDLGQFKKCECELVAFLKARGLPTTDNLTCSVIGLIFAMSTFQQLSFPMHLHHVSSESTLLRSGICTVLTHMMFLLIMNLTLVCIKRNFLASLIFTVPTFECQLLNTPLLKQQDLVHSASRAVDLFPGRPDRAYVASRIASS